jgi:hypothetical protein
MCEFDFFVAAQVSLNLEIGMCPVVEGIGEIQRQSWGALLSIPFVIGASIA